MTPLEALRKVVRELESNGILYCLIGGHAASLYRRHERTTKDVDIAILGADRKNEKELAIELIRSIGLEPLLGFIPRRGDTESTLSFITSHPEQGQEHGPLDILFSTLPWVPEAVERAQHNKIDVMFATLPVITPEDLILAKCFALHDNSDRFQDLDDLKELFQNDLDLDLEYLILKFEELKIPIPQLVRKFVPEQLGRFVE